MVIHLYISHRISMLKLSFNEVGPNLRQGWLSEGRGAFPLLPHLKITVLMLSESLGSFDAVLVDYFERTKTTG